MLLDAIFCYPIFNLADTLSLASFDLREPHFDFDLSFKDPECTQPKWQLVPYFCGQDPRCRKKEQWAVDKAKENIEQYYVAVGIGNFWVNLAISVKGRCLITLRDVPWPTMIETGFTAPRFPW